MFCLNVPYRTVSSLRAAALRRGRAARPQRRQGRLYFFDPARNCDEVFAGGLIYYPDNPKRVWSIDKIGKAIFYYQRELNERFMSVVT
jgi:hypothetical protein